MAEITRIRPLDAHGKPSGAELKVMWEAEPAPSVRVSLMIPSHFAGTGITVDLASAEMLAIAIKAAIIEARLRLGHLAPMPADGVPLVAGWADIDEIVGMADFAGLAREAEAREVAGDRETAAIFADALAALVAVREIARRGGVFERKGGSK